MCKNKRLFVLKNRIFAQNIGKTYSKTIMIEDILDLLNRHHIKPTANRIVIAQTLARSAGPMSLKEIETRIQTMDKSSISRTLSLFKSQHLVHIMEDGDGSVCYELCLADHHSTMAEDEDLHAHFFCMMCHRTFCLDEGIPVIDLPEGFVMRSVNYMVKGLCPVCAKKCGTHL